MSTNPLASVGKIVKNVAGGAVNKTLARLKGSGIQRDSRLVKARAKWSGRGGDEDWRVKLTIPEGSPLKSELMDNNKLMEPLQDSNGIFWPLTPSMVIQHTASYNALSQTHSTYPFQAYQNSQVDQINIVGEFPVQNSEDAKYWVATVKFLRTVTKMFFGAEGPLKGNPPPILKLSGFGTNMFENVPVIVNTFNVELRSGIDYISTSQDRVYQRTGSNIPVPHSPDDDTDPTWAPTLSLISVLVTPTYSRESIKNFDLGKFARGQLGGSENLQGIGFI